MTKNNKMKNKIGRLERVKKFGIFGDLEIVVEGEKLYKRTPCEEIPKDIKYLVGRRILVEYEETTTFITDWIADKIFFACFKIPRHYNQIKKIKQIKSVYLAELSNHRDDAIQENQPIREYYDMDGRTHFIKIK